MKHLETIFPELHSELEKGYTDLFRMNADGSLTCLNNPDPDYSHYRLERFIVCLSHPATLYLYVSNCGSYKGVLIDYWEHFENSSSLTFEL